jgi:hypothetical protein
MDGARTSGAKAIGALGAFWSFVLRFLDSLGLRAVDLESTLRFLPFTANLMGGELSRM